MHTITSRPETRSDASTDHVVERASTPVSSTHADLVLVAAPLVPLAIVGLLVLIGVGFGAAVCIMFASVFAVTTALDVTWLRRSRRDPNDLRTGWE